MFNNKIEKESIAVAPTHYERINFLFDFKINGYAKKILCLYEDANLSEEAVYYNNRERTEVACVDKDIFILSNHDNGLNTYTLVQVDFSLPLKYKILMVQNTDMTTNTYAKNELYMYMRQANLVEINQGKRKKKQPQIDFGYGNMLIEIMEFLYNSIHPDATLNEGNLVDLLKKNAWRSIKFVAHEKEFTCKESASIRFNRSIEDNLNLIYHHSDKDELTITEVLSYIKKYQENYYYNI